MVGNLDASLLSSLVFRLLFWAYVFCVCHLVDRAVFYQRVPTSSCRVALTASLGIAAFSMYIFLQSCVDGFSRVCSLLDVGLEDPMRADLHSKTSS